MKRVLPVIVIVVFFAATMLGGALFASPKETVEIADAKCKNGYVALTYDDGPTEITPALVDELNKHNLKATFFISGYKVAGNENLIREISQKHQIQNHSYYHDDHIELTRTEVKQSVSKGSAAIREVTGIKPTLFRPPLGSTNSTVADIVRDNNSVLALWTLDTFDWQDNSVSTVMSKLSNIEDGDIVLMHDNLQEDVELVSKISKLLDDKGLCTEFITASEKRTEAWEGNSFNAEVSKPTRQTGHRIVIDSIGLDVAIAEGVGLNILDTGVVGHFPQTAGLGEEGNYALAGHRITHGEPFRNIVDLRAGNKIRVLTNDSTYVYKVFKDPYVVDHSALWVLKPMPQIGDSIITLVTCASLLPTDERTIVHATLINVNSNK